MRVPSQVDRFIAAVHRRAVVVRLAERVGLFLAVAAGVGAVLILVAGSLRVDPTPLVVAGIVVAATLGLIWGWMRRPTVLDAVVEADRQLHLDDLLSTAMLAGEDGFGRAVRVMAERACGRLSPSAVVVGRLGGRAWGGIGLAWAVVLVLSLLSGGGASTRAGDSWTRGPSDERRDPLTGQPLVQSQARHLVGAATGTDEGRPFGDVGAQVGPVDTRTASGTSGDPSQGVAGQGAGSARTDVARVEPTTITNSGAGSPSTTGDPAGGAGVGQAKAGTGAAGGLAGRVANHAAAPWRSERWPNDRTAALQAVQDGRVPDAYRDLVRAYFDEPDRR